MFPKIGSCLSMSKNTILKANHNRAIKLGRKGIVVYQCLKIQF